MEVPKALFEQLEAMASVSFRQCLAYEALLTIALEMSKSYLSRLTKSDLKKCLEFVSKKPSPHPIC